MPLFGIFSNIKTGFELLSMSKRDIPPSLYEDTNSGDELTLVFECGDPIASKSVGIIPSKKIHK